jgi:hypothetical protein
MAERLFIHQAIQVKDKKSSDELSVGTDCWGDKCFIWEIAGKAANFSMMTIAFCSLVTYSMVIRQSRFLSTSPLTWIMDEQGCHD